MQTTAVIRDPVAWFILQSACLSVTSLCCKKTAKRIGVLFGVKSQLVPKTNLTLALTLSPKLP